MNPGGLTASQWAWLMMLAEYGTWKISTVGSVRTANSLQKRGLVRWCDPDTTELTSEGRRLLAQNGAL